MGGLIYTLFYFKGIQATDKDFGNNAQIKYTLNGTDAHCFGIDDKIGNLNLKCAIDPSVSSYSFNVRLLLICVNVTTNSKPNC